MSEKPVLPDYLLLFGIGLLWGGQFVLNAVAVAQLPPITVAASRILIGALTLSAVTCCIREPRGKTATGRIAPGYLYVAVAFFEAVLPMFLITWGQQQVDSSVTAMLLGSVPILTLLLSVFMSRKSHFNRYSLLSVVLGFIGIIVLMHPAVGNHENGSFISEVAVFCGALSFACSINLMDFFPVGAPIRVVRNVLWLSAIPLAAASLALDRPWLLHWTAPGIGSVLVLGTVCSAAAYVMYATLVQRSGPVFTSLSGFIVPLVGVILGIVLRGEPFGMRESTALALVIVALAVNELAPRFGSRRAMPPRPAPVHAD